MLGHKKVIDDVFTPTPVEFTEPVQAVKVACGGGHTLVLTELIDEGSEYDEYSETASEDEGPDAPVKVPINTPPSQTQGAAAAPSPQELQQQPPLSSAASAPVRGPLSPPLQGGEAAAQVGIGSVARANRRSVHSSV